MKKIDFDLMENINQPIAVMNNHFEYIYFNNTFENLFSIDKKDYLGKTDHLLCTEATCVP